MAIEPSHVAGPVEGYSLDPSDPEELTTTLGEIVSFLNAERAAAGHPKARSILLVALDIPYAELGEPHAPP